MLINLIYDAQALAAPQSFRDGMEAAVLMLERHILDDITVNINIGYGEHNGVPVSADISTGGPGATLNGAGLDLSYTDLRAALAGHNTSPTDQTVLDNLPTADNIEGQTTFRIANAQARALGKATANDATVDGSIGMGTGFTGTRLRGSPARPKRWEPTPCHGGIFLDRRRHDEIGRFRGRLGSRRFPQWRCAG